MPPTTRRTRRCARRVGGAPLPKDTVRVHTVAGLQGSGYRDGAAATARGDGVHGFALLPDGRVLVTDEHNNRIRMLSADLQQMSTVAGDGTFGYRDGAAAQAQFSSPTGLAVLPDGRVLVVDFLNNRIRALSADLQQVSTAVGEGGYGYRDGAAAQAQFFSPRDLAVLPDGRVLIADSTNHRIRILSADLQQVSTLAGGDLWFDSGYRDGAAAQAQFGTVDFFALLPDGRVLVADHHRIRMLSADLQQVSTVAGDVDDGYRDGSAAQARFWLIQGFAVLPDGRVLVADCLNQRIRMLSADLQQVSTVAGDGTRAHRDGAAAQARFMIPKGLALLPDGRVLVACLDRIRLLSGFVQMPTPRQHMAAHRLQRGFARKILYDPQYGRRAILRRAGYSEDDIAADAASASHKKPRGRPRNPAKAACLARGQIWRQGACHARRRKKHTRRCRAK
jgi:hypothetical protein